VSGSYDKTVRIWDGKTGAKVTKIEGHSNWAWIRAYHSHESAYYAIHTAPEWTVQDWWSYPEDILGGSTRRFEVLPGESSEEHIGTELGGGGVYALRRSASDTTVRSPSFAVWTQGIREHLTYLRFKWTP
jgi:WD40 repeat protein